MTPETIGRYEIIAELGRGGMATVYRARDPRFGREVAIKILPPQFVEAGQFRARFEREARTIAALEHPAIVPVYDFGEHQSQPYLVMRLMSGGSLADRLKKGPLRPDVVARILERIGSALDEAHRRGIVHRDLKPGNILFDQYDDAYLSDFGIVRLSESESTLTGEHTIGTPGYMSPEQIQGEPIDGRTDIYALGIMVFQMLTGELPYSAPTPAMVMVKHLTEPVPDIRKLNPDLPAALSQVLTQTMAKDRDSRPATAGEVARLLAVASAATGEAARLLAESRPAPTEVSPTKVAATEEEAPDGPVEAAETKVEAPAGVDAAATEIASSDEKAPAAPPSPTVDETEIMTPDFAPRRPEPEPAGRRRVPLWLLGLIGVFAVAVIGGGIVLTAVLGDDDDEDVVVVDGDEESVTGDEQEETPPTPAKPVAEESVDPNSEAPGGTGDDAADPRVAELLDEAWTALDDGEATRVLAVTAEIHALDPGNAQAWQVRGFAFRDLLNQPRAALEAFYRAAEHSPDTWWYYADLAWTHDQVGESRLALQNARRCVELAADEPDCQIARGVFAGRVGEYDEALSAFAAAERLAPSYSPVFFERGFMLEQMGNTEEAVANYQRAVELGTDQPYDYYSLAAALNHLFRFEEALAAADECIGRFPEYGDCYLEMATALRETGEPEAAAEVLDAGVNRVTDPEERYWLLMSIGYAYREIDELDRAEEAFTRAADTLPRQATDAFVELAWLVLDRGGEPGEATAFADRAIALSPDNPYAYNVLGHARIAAEDPAGAVDAYRQMLERMPTNECPECVSFARDFIAEAQEESEALLAATSIQTVSVPGSWNVEVGCAEVWQPACPAIQLEEVEEGTWRGEFDLPAGEWEVKVAINNAWEVNFGQLGLKNGLNIPFALERDGRVTFTFTESDRRLQIRFER